MRLLCLIAAAVVVVFLSACATTQDPNAIDTKPWNVPEKWEGQGPMGGMMPGTQ